MAQLVMKFGGTSVGTAEWIRRAAGGVRREARSHQVVVVVSALAGVTDMIAAALHSPKLGCTAEVAALCDNLRSRHRQVIEETFSDAFPAVV